MEEAKEIIEEAARENKQLVPHHLYKRAEIEALEEASLVESAESESDMFQEGRKDKTCITDVFRNCTMALRTLNMCFQVNIVGENIFLKVLFCVILSGSV